MGYTKKSSIRKKIKQTRKYRKRLTKKYRKRGGFGTESQDGEIIIRPSIPSINKSSAGHWRETKKARTFRQRDYTPNINESIMFDKSDGTTFYSGLFHNMNYRGTVTKEGPYNLPMPNGPGKLTYNNGDVYEGNFVNGKRSGFGKMTVTQNGLTKNFEGNWENDAFTGK